MGKEIEHKYLVISEDYKKLAKKKLIISQGYLSKDPERVVRIRICNDEGRITIKGKTNFDTRLEFEYPLPLDDARKMLNLCVGKKIKKIRWIVEYAGYVWEVDEFQEPVFPTIAEIELTESSHNYPLPHFIGEEVTGDSRYFNSNIG